MRPLNLFSELSLINYSLCIYIYLTAIGVFTLPLYSLSISMSLGMFLSFSLCPYFSLPSFCPYFSLSLLPYFSLCLFMFLSLFLCPCFSLCSCFALSSQKTDHLKQTIKGGQQYEPVNLAGTSYFDCLKVFVLLASRFINRRILWDKVYETTASELDIFINCLGLYTEFELLPISQEKISKSAYTLIYRALFFYGNFSFKSVKITLIISTGAIV